MLSNKSGLTHGVALVATTFVALTCLTLPAHASTPPKSIHVGTAPATGHVNEVRKASECEDGRVCFYSEKDLMGEMESYPRNNELCSGNLIRGAKSAVNAHASAVNDQPEDRSTLVVFDEADCHGSGIGISSSERENLDFVGRSFGFRPLY
ncbi:MAG: peptidase inhibitor family I36 protein [Pseudonocardiaceae bacterium]